MSQDSTARLADALMRIYQKLNLYREETMQVNPTELAVMLLVDEHGQCRVSDLAEALRLPMSTVSWTANKMVDKHILKRKPDPADRRAILLELAQAGKETVAKNNELYQDISSMIERNLSAEQFDLVLSMAENLAASFE